MRRAAVLSLAVAVTACLPGVLTLEAQDSMDGSVGADASADGLVTGGDAGADSYVDVGTFDAPPICDAAGVACVPAAPGGWTGPFAFYEGPAAGAPGCTAATNFPSTVLDGHGPLDGNAPPAQCAPCACTPPSTAGCPANLTIQWYSDMNCTQACTSSTGDSGGGGCPAIDVACSAHSFIAPAPAPGACTAGGGSATLPALPWGSTARACAPPALPQSDCPSGSLCSPVPPVPFGAKMCVSRTGNMACPSGPYSSQTSAYSGATDTRGCAACGCGGIQGYTCGGAAINPGEDCFGPPALSQPLSSACTSLAGYAGMATYSLLGGAGSPDSGACAPSGGTPMGTVTPNPVTVCCLP